MKILTVVDWAESGRWIWRDLPTSGDRHDIVSLKGVRVPRSSLERATLYPVRYLRAGLGVLPRLSDYDVVFSWEVKCGFPIALYQSLVRQSKPRHVILGFILKGVLARHPFLARALLRSVAGIVCFSSRERDLYRNLLRLPPERVHFIPLAWDVTEDEGVDPTVWEDYVLSVGSSNRDYKTLFEAAKSIAARFLVVAHPYNLHGLSIPPNVEVRYNLPSADVARLLRRARAVVVPLNDTSFAAGQNVVLRAMSAGRAVIATRIAGTEDYIKDGDTGIFVAPNNSDELTSAIESLLTSPARVQQLGIRARHEAVTNHSFATFARSLSHLAIQLADDE